MIGTKIHITGIVQGVGFRPFIYNQATQRGLTGWVRNTSGGVDIEIFGEDGEIKHFIEGIRNNAPSLSRIDTFEHYPIPHHTYTSFEIISSKEVSNAFQPISPDICICDDCLRELFDPENRRYRYPFINCTNCGPRLTIISEIPYDRPNTTMKDFPLCPDCAKEYEDPLDRRFHAQPVACPVCGPKVWLEYPGENEKHKDPKPIQGENAIAEVQRSLTKGGIVAIKGLGGFHLACDATNTKAVSELRKRKLRVDKPFALMMPDLESIISHCYINDIERELIYSRERPIVILPRRASSTIAKEVSPHQNTLGVMLPYSPLHYLLFSKQEEGEKHKHNPPVTLPPLVMTSGNISEEPIAYRNDEARAHLSGLVDVFLMHDRDIRTRCDDSVLRTYRGATFPLRRSRGYAPFPVYLESDSPQVLAVGAELKNTFCITRQRYAFLSHHIGDMENVETLDSFMDSVQHYESLFRIQPQAIAYDLHPNYLATRYALERAKREHIPSFGIQHHHAHIVSCMAENSLPPDCPVIGVAFDGTGYGEDQAIWGGEFLLADFRGYERVGHLKYIPLPGGDTAIRKPARVALAYLWAYEYDWEPEYYPVFALCAEERSIIKAQLEKHINAPLTSSMGRLFDAIASIAGIRHQVNYEAQAAIEFEALADPEETGAYELSLEKVDGHSSHAYQVDAGLLIGNVLQDLQNGVPPARISSRFHNGVARMVSDMCIRLRQDYGINDVVLSGGVWQNLTLLTRTYDSLVGNNFTVYTHKQVPTNDGGLALGQAVITIHRLAT
jgi:hydrogenase maturation protein HypF